MLSGELNSLICNEVKRMDAESTKTTSDFGVYRCLYDECSDGFNDIGEFSCSQPRSSVSNRHKKISLYHFTVLTIKKLFEFAELFRAFSSFFIEF